MKKLSLYDWYAKEEGESPEESKVFIVGLLDSGGNVAHLGDCTGHSCPCDLCVLQSILEDYARYTFDKEFWKEYRRDKN